MWTRTPKVPMPLFDVSRRVLVAMIAGAVLAAVAAMPADAATAGRSYTTLARGGVPVPQESTNCTTEHPWSPKGTARAPVPGIALASRGKQGARADRDQILLGRLASVAPGDDPTPIFDDPRSLVVVLFGTPVADPRFTREFLMVESLPLYVSRQRPDLRLSRGELTTLLTKATDWSQFGYAQGKVTLHVPSDPLRRKRVDAFVSGERGVPLAPEGPRLEPAEDYTQLANSYAKDPDCLVVGLRGGTPDGLRCVEVDGLSPDRALVAQPAAYWRLVGVNPRTVPNEWTAAGQWGLLVDEKSDANPNPALAPGEQAQPTGTPVGQLYPLRQSVYLYVRGCASGSADANAAAACRSLFLDTVRKTLLRETPTSACPTPALAPGTVWASVWGDASGPPAGRPEAPVAAAAKEAGGGGRRAILAAPAASAP